jgi:hypothetical protein
VLDEVDAARLAHPDAADSYWIGVITKPPGVTTSRWAGMAFLPLQGAASSMFARASVVLGREWTTSDPRARGGTVAHELGHNFGRYHAPCGNVGWVDDSYTPYSGRAGRWVHVLIDWMNGVADTARVLDPDEYGDIMSYCGPKTVGPYTYSGILGFRQSFGAALVADQAPVRVLAVRGTYGAAGVRLYPAQTLRARPSGASSDRAVVVELLAADGRVLASVPAHIGEFGEGGPERPFGIQFALTSELERELHEIRVYTPAGTARLVSPVGGGAAAAAAIGASSEAEAGGGTRVRCADAAARSIVVQDAASGRLLGTARGAELVVRAARGAPLTVWCGDGVRSVESAVVAR